MAEIKLYSNNREKPESVYIRKSAKDVMSQCGEDGMIEKIFDILGTTNRWCVEFGAWDGKKFSNSWALINNHAWNAVLIEGDQNRFNQLTENYASNDNVILRNTFVGIDAGNSSLDSILGQSPVPKDFDFLCIDVDGCDWYIWESLTKYHPRFVLIEFNPTIPNHVYFVQEKDIRINHGTSLHAMIDLGKEKGYELIATTNWNAFFVREEDFPKFNIDDNSIDSMHFSGRYESAFFQLYDGTVVLAGCTKLIWCGVPISFEDIQVLPRALRKYRG